MLPPSPVSRESLSPREVEANGGGLEGAPALAGGVGLALAARVFRVASNEGAAAAPSVKASMRSAARRVTCGVIQRGSCDMQRSCFSFALLKPETQPPGLPTGAERNQLGVLKRWSKYGASAKFLAIGRSVALAYLLNK